VIRKRAVLVSILGLLGAVALICAGTILWLATADLRPMVEQYVSTALHRRVSIGMFQIGWGNPLSLEVRDFSVANPPWADEPNLVSIESVSAKIDPWSLFGSVLRFQKLIIVKPVIVLERDKDGTGNWKFSGAVSSSQAPVAVGPTNRGQFPMLLDLALHEGKASYRTSSGAWLRFDLRDATIRSTGDDRPVMLAIAGAYNDTPVKLTAETQSFAAMRDRSRPFGVSLSFTTASSTIDFKGTTMDPLNFDGAKGAIKIDTRKLGDFLALFNGRIEANPPLLLAGDLQRNDAYWQITSAKGKIAGSKFDGMVALAEEGRAKPDDVSMNLHFVDLDLNQLLSGADKAYFAKTADYTAFSLRIEAKRGTNIDASVDAKQVAYGATRIADVGMHLRLRSGEATLDQLAFAFTGGRMDASGSALAVAGGSHVVARGVLAGADAAQLSRFVDALAGRIGGKVDGAFALDMTGDTLGNALRAGRGQAVLGMVQGSVSRDLMEKLSTNLLNLLRSGEGSVQVACLLGIVDLRYGVAAISPLRLRSKAGTLIGGGQVDILGKRLDITIQSEPSTTGFFALDIPVRVSGSFANPNIDPRLGGGAATRQALINNNPTRELSGELRGFAERNPCLH
jgi:AsmA family protein